MLSGGFGGKAPVDVSRSRRSKECCGCFMIVELRCVSLIDDVLGWSSQIPLRQPAKGVTKMSCLSGNSFSRNFLTPRPNEKFSFNKKQTEYK